MNANWYRSQSLGNGLSLNANLHGQFAFTPLLSPQECGYGGSRFGRGYDASSFIGDHCAFGSLELSYALPLDLKPMAGVEVFGFVDGGLLWQQNANGRTEAGSVGVGTRFRAFDYLQVSTEVSRPTDGNDLEEDELTAWLKLSYKIP